MVVRTVRRALRPVRQLYESTRIWLKEAPYRQRRSRRGSVRWLIESEIRYGGFVTSVERRKVSRRDPRTLEQLAFGGMTGGDRMLHNGYAEGYAKHLARFLSADGLTLAEFGILKGSGLAMWCDLFPTARVVGLDIDLGHFERNRPELEQRGAFRENAPVLAEYDQFADGREILRDMLGGGALDIVIDDGFHSLETIRNTWRSCEPNLAERFVYFVEDFPNLLENADGEFAKYQTTAYGALTVIER